MVEATPLGLEMVTALAHRGLETHLVDPRPWALAEVADPDIMQPVQDSWADMGVKMHFNTPVEAFIGDGKVRAVKTPDEELPADVVVICTHKQPNNRLAREAGIKIGSTGGIIVDQRMHTRTEGVYAAGDCAEIPHGVTKVPIQGLSGSHAYAQGKVAGTSAAGGRPRVQPGRRAVGDGGRQVDDRRRLVRRDHRERVDVPLRSWASPRASRGRATTPT